MLKHLLGKKQFLSWYFFHRGYKQQLVNSFLEKQETCSRRMLPSFNPVEILMKWNLCHYSRVVASGYFLKMHLKTNYTGWELEHFNTPITFRKETKCIKVVSVFFHSLSGLSTCHSALTVWRLHSPLRCGFLFLAVVVCFDSFLAIGLEIFARS